MYLPAWPNDLELARDREVHHSGSQAALWTLHVPDWASINDQRQMRPELLEFLQKEGRVKSFKTEGPYKQTKPK